MSRRPTESAARWPGGWVGTIFRASHRDIHLLPPGRAPRGHSRRWAPALLEGSERRRVWSGRFSAFAVSLPARSPPPQLLRLLCQLCGCRRVETVPCVTDSTGNGVGGGLRVHGLGSLTDSRALKQSIKLLWASVSSFVSGYKYCLPRRLLRPLKTANESAPDIVPGRPANAS